MVVAQKYDFSALVNTSVLGWIGDCCQVLTGVANMSLTLMTVILQVVLTIQE